MGDTLLSRAMINHQMLSTQKGASHPRIIPSVKFYIVGEAIWLEKKKMLPTNPSPCSSSPSVAYKTRGGSKETLFVVVKGVEDGSLAHCRSGDTDAGLRAHV